MKAIFTKYVPATNFRGTRVKATDEDKNSVSLSWDDALDTFGNHRAAAEALIRKMKWNPTEIVAGSLKNGYVWTMLEYRPGVPVERYRVNPKGRKLVVKRGRKIVAKATFAPGYAQRKRAKRLLRVQYENRGVKINPRKRRARNVTEAMRNMGRRALVNKGADHFVQVRRGNKWVSLAAFFDKAAALDYGRALARKYRRAMIRYFSPDEGKSFKKNPDENKRYRVTYFYQSPGRAGPFKGKDVLNYKPKRGDQIRAPFGLAIVKSVREIKDELKENPTAELSASGEAAARRLERFTGHEAARARSVPIPTADAGLEIGPCLLIGYETIRDGKREKYIHRFSTHARPLLAASSDGRSLFLLGGAYRFTDRGIVDKKR